MVAGSNAGQADGGRRCKATPTLRTSSLTSTTPSRSQSPGQPRGEAVGVTVGVATIGVTVGLVTVGVATVGVTVGGSGVAVTVGVGVRRAHRQSHAVCGGQSRTRPEGHGKHCTHLHP